MKDVVTYSELRTRRRCAYRGYLNYDLRLRPRIKKPGLREGTIWDKGIEAFYLAGGLVPAATVAMLGAMELAMEQDMERIMAVGGLFDEELAVINERYELLREMAKRYVVFASENDPFDAIITGQLMGSTPVISPSGAASSKYDFWFKADGLVVIEGQLWLREDKAWKSWDQNMIAALQMDEQCGMYLWGLLQTIERRTAPKDVLAAVKQYGPPVGVFYNVSRKKLPAIPKLLRDGSTSRDQRVDTTEQAYRETLIARDQDPADYAEILETLRDKGNTFYYREAIYRNANELAEIGERIYQGTRLKAEGHRYKFPTRDCHWDCEYLPLCLEWSDNVAQTQYEISEHKHMEYQEVAA